MFTACPVPSIIYINGETVVNRPVNLAICTHMAKTNYAWYPDNEGKPAIKFYPSSVEWVFDKVTERDDCYNSLIKTN